jgi:pyruvate dehydrogenase E2 component (dihydrolipoamide acetyltransferase)
MRQFLVPDLGIGNKDAKIVAWHVAEGDHIVAEGPLVSLETEKVAVEIASPWSGHVARLLAQAGDQVKVGAPIAEFTDGSEDATAVGRLAVSPRKVTQAVAPTSASAETRQFLLPDLGIGNKDAAIVAWHVAEGDYIAANEQLVSVETEKATVEIPSPWSGRIARVLANAGDQVKVGTPLVVLTVSAGDAQDRSPPAVAKPVAPKQERPQILATLQEPPPAPLAQAAPAVDAPTRDAPTRNIGANRESRPPGPIARADTERVAASVSEATTTARKVKRVATAGNRLVFAIEMAVIFLCGMFLVWWIATMG